MMASSLLCCCLLFFITTNIHSADGFLNYDVDRCVFNSTELKDIEYIYSSFYNKLELYRFTSSLGKYVGYTEYGVKQADYFNKDASEIAGRMAQREAYCLNNVGNEWRGALTKSVEPTVRLYSRTPPGGSQQSLLVCRVYDFFPKTIKVSWLRDGQEVTSDVTTTEEMEDGDWYYQVHSTLEYRPRSGEKISCMVEHVSLKEPLITEWNPSLPESERSKLAIGASGLILGLVLSLAGFIYYKRKMKGRILVPTN